RSECTRYNAIGSEIEIRIFENNDWIFSTHLTLRFHTAHCARRVNLRAVVRGSCKRNASYAEVTRQNISYVGTASDNKVQYARRQSCPFENVEEPGGCQRRCGRGFEDDRIAGDQRGRNFPGGNTYRKVPGRDQRHHTKRVPQCVGKILWQFGGNGYSTHP